MTPGPISLSTSRYARTHAHDPMLASTVKLCKLVITTTLHHMCFGGKDAEDVGQLGCMV
jgi:hypothetical protein